MNDNSFAGDSQDLVLVQFVQELQHAAQPDAVLSEFCARHPDLADELRSLAMIGQRMGDASPPLAQLPTRRLQPGQELGDFVITRLMAAGGMGEVYEAMQSRLKRRVAVKVVRRGRVAPIDRIRFRREQRMLAKLHQTHIVPIYADGEAGDVQYFAMAFIDGAPLNRVVDSVYHRETSQGVGKTPSLRDLAASPQLPPDLGTDQDTKTDASKSPFNGSKDPTIRIQLSVRYVRSVAEVMAQAADAIQYAHEMEIYHRDIKPSNLMVDRHGHCWIIDFGLAGLLIGSDESPQDDSIDETVTRGAIGTPQYMSPEQHQGQPIALSDVWGLGATLYELLTLRRAFDGPTRESIAERVAENEPIAPRLLAPPVPRDLDAICQKALKKEPTDRYQSPGDFAADLRRWLNHEPTIARPARAPRRLAMWARRNKGWATAITVVLLGLAGLAATALRQSQLELAQQSRMRSILDLQNIRQNPTRAMGWSQFVLNGAQRFADGHDRQTYAASSLIGLDATMEWSWPRHDVGPVAFYPDGLRLVMGGRSRFHQGRGLHTHGFHWSGQRDHEPQPTAQIGQCVIAFGPDGKPVQLVGPIDERKSLLVWDTESQKTIQEIALPVDWATTHDIAFSSDGKLAAFSYASNQEPSQGRILVWEAIPGRLVRSFDQVARTIAISPDNQLVAVTDSSNETHVWSISTGEKLFSLPAERNAITCLAFGHSPFRAIPKQAMPGNGHWLLAAGMQGGPIVIWDLDVRSVMTRCHGATYAVNDIAFCPDGMTLAAVGRSPAKVFDIFSGHLLLDINGPNNIKHVAFSQDGKRMAISGTEWNAPAGVKVYNVENGRGLQSLRGITGPVQKIAMTADAKWIAALGQNWQIALWNTELGLRHLLEVPPGSTADNATLVFDPSGSRLVYSGGDRALMWNVKSGQRLDEWKLKPGLNDALAITADGQVFSFRSELVSGSRYPTNAVPAVNDPRVRQLRELLPNGEVRLIKSISDHSEHQLAAIAAVESTIFVGEGIGRDKRQTIIAYDGRTGRRVWSIEQPHNRDSSGLSIDATGTTFIYSESGPPSELSPRFIQMEIATRRYMATFDERPLAIGSMGQGFLNSTPTNMGLTYAALKSSEPTVTLGIDQKPTFLSPCFNRTGTHCAWGNTDGTVTFCDINDVLRRLTVAGVR